MVWEDDIIEKANTARNARYLKESEKQVIFYTNLARINGELFADTYIVWYLESTGMKPDSFTISLREDLKGIRDYPLLYPENNLYDVARNHAVKSGKSGTEGHQGIKKRFRDMKEFYSEYGENCYYGPDNPLIIVIQLLIDEDIPDLGHRKNLLYPTFNSIGVSIMPHKVHKYNCVMEFGWKNGEN